MQYFKLQIGCMLIVLYVAFIYIREKYEYKVKQKEPVFELLLITGILSIVFDGATAYTVNYLDKVPGLVNDVLHACFLCGLDTLSFVIFLYMYDITRGVPKSRKIKTLIILPLAICHCSSDSVYATAGVPFRQNYQLFHGNFCVYLFYYGRCLYAGNGHSSGKRLEKYGTS